LPFLQAFTDDKGAFHHEFAPRHNSKTVKKFIQGNKIGMLDWPGNSPDMHPVENFGSILKAHLGKMDCSTEERMVTNVMKVWFHDSGVRSVCSKLIEAMPKCIQQVILAKRGNISY
jgi:hypothetical protein